MIVGGIQKREAVDSGAFYSGICSFNSGVIRVGYLGTWLELHALDGDLTVAAAL